jgi:hypothetical protein
VPGRRGDLLRITLLAVGPGLLLATVALEIGGWGVAGPPVVRYLFTYATLLLCALPALPVISLALAAAFPSAGRGSAGAWAFYVIAPLWHVAVAEACQQLDNGRSVVGAFTAPLAASYLTLTAATAVGWVAYVRRKRRTVTC